MPTEFPTDLDDYTNPTPQVKVGSEVGGRTHSEFHSDNNDAIEAMQAKIGIDGSNDPDSLDAKTADPLVNREDGSLLVRRDTGEILRMRS